MSDRYLTAILADDEPAITEGLSSLSVWNELGIKVIATASTGPEAIEAILKYKPDFAVMDIMMPGMTGLEVLEKLEEASSETDVIILSGYGRFDYARKALRFQAKAYLLKPVDAAELRGTLLSLMKKKSKINNEDFQLSRSALNDLADGKLMDSLAVSMLTSGSKGISDGPCFAIIFSFQSQMKEGTVSTIENATEGIKRIVWTKDQKTARAIFCISERMPFEIAEVCLKALENEKISIPRIAVGNVVEKPSMIATSFSRAAIALSYQLYDENARIFTADIIAPTAPEYKPDDKDTEILSEYIVKDDENGILKFTDDFIKRLIGKTLPPPNYVYSITHWLASEIRKRLASLISGTSLFSDSPDITKFRTIPQLREGLSSLFVSIARYINAVYGEEEAVKRIEGMEEDDQIIKRMSEYIDTHSEEQIRLEDIAYMVNLSPSYAAIYFRKKTGITVRDYILQKKMETARKKLLEKDVSVTDIAYALGYHDYRSFSRAFKNITGMTPSEFQEENCR